MHETFFLRRKNKEVASVGGKNLINREVILDRTSRVTHQKFADRHIQRVWGDRLKGSNLFAGLAYLIRDQI